MLLSASVNSISSIPENGKTKMRMQFFFSRAEKKKEEEEKTEEKNRFVVFQFWQNYMKFNHLPIHKHMRA